jgi:hypothetical protein
MHARSRLWLGIGIVAIFILSCKHLSDNSSSAKAVGDDELARFSLDALGIDRPSYTGGPVCGGACHTSSWHTADQVFVENVSVQTKGIKACFDQAGTDDKAWVACLKDPSGQWRGDIGIYRAGLHTALFTQKFQSALGSAYQEELNDLISKKGMPPASDKPGATAKLSESQFTKVLSWFNLDTPGLSKAFPPKATNETCTESINTTAMKTYIKGMELDNWEMLNSEKGVSMFGCTDPKLYTPESGEEPRPYEVATNTCFRQKVAGKPKFPLAEEISHAAGWSDTDSKDNVGDPLLQRMRILKVMPWKQENGLNVKSTYWMRSSADGRYVGNGMSNSVKKFMVDYKAYVIDLLDDRVSFVSADYDPAFFPNNKGFSFMQFDAKEKSDKAWFCNQQLFNEKLDAYQFKDHDNYCFRDDKMGVYQHLSVSPNGVDHIVVRSDDYSNDSGAVVVHQDPPVSAFAYDESKVEVHVLQESGQKYAKPTGPALIPLPYEGDFSVSPNGKILISRFTSRDGEGPSSRVQLGYKLRKMKVETVANAAPKVTLEDLATVCLAGGKATMSFNERFMALHHYKPDPFTSATNQDRFKQSRSDVYLVDLWTGRKYQITNMSKGQYALYAHFRSDNWLYILVRDVNRQEDTIIATDAALRIGTAEQLQN